MQQHSERDSEQTRLQIFHLLASYILNTYSQCLDTRFRQYVVCSSLGVGDHAESQPATHVTNEHDSGQQAALAAWHSRLMYRRWANAVFPGIQH